MTSAAVFAYHDVGARCLRTLLAHGIQVPLVITHQDAPEESVWFESVATVASNYGILVLMPDSPNDPEFVERIRHLAPDFIFSFYYRRMLAPELLAVARRGGFNMHGSLLPQYRGRAPVNWAILRGELETGATLHEMVAKPDAGRIVDQQRVPILPDDIARDVMAKVTVAAEIVLDRSIDALVAGTASLREQDLTQGSYFGARRPEDGRIDWSRPAREVHNLVRAVAPPYPGAFCNVRGCQLRIQRTLLLDQPVGPAGLPTLTGHVDSLYLRCADGGLLRVLQAEVDGTPLLVTTLRSLLGSETVALNS